MLSIVWLKKISIKWCPLKDRSIKKAIKVSAFDTSGVFELDSGSKTVAIENPIIILICPPARERAEKAKFSKSPDIKPINSSLTIKKSMLEVFISTPESFATGKNSIVIYRARAVFMLTDIDAWEKNGIKAKKPLILVKRSIKVIAFLSVIKSTKFMNFC